MKKFYSLFAAFTFTMLTVPAFAQLDCSDGRYYNRTYFTDFDTTENILFGSGPAVGNGQTQELRMCVFEPQGDQLAKRPLIVFTFGGSFVTGERTQVYAMCEEFVKMGYVVAATDYRVGFFFPSEVTTTQAVVRGMHDMKAAIRYFYKDAQTVNEFNIDTNYIIVGGVSAGAICAIHTAYLSENSEIPPYMYNDTTGMGGVEGHSGNPGYSSKVIGVIDFSGTIGDTAWINAGDPAIVGLHDLGDQTVPYGTGPVAVGGFPTGLTAHGTGTIIVKTDELSIPNAQKTYPGNGHVAYLQGTQQEWDEAVDYTKEFVADLVCGSLTPASVKEEGNGVVGIYPNPSNGVFTITFSNAAKQNFTGTVTDVMGRTVKTFSTNTEKANLDCTDLTAGIYSVAVNSATQRFTGKVIVK
jgi:para-nitrobenzyl esterase